MKVNLRLADPDVRRMSSCFDETIASMSKGFCQLGHEIGVGGIDIVFGFHMNPREITHRSIIYQQEPVSPKTLSEGNVPISYLKNHIVWDYSRHNVSLLQSHDVKAIYVPSGYAGTLDDPTQICPDAQCIDILFYGNCTEYRRKILEALKARKLKVVEVFGLYHTDLDELLQKSKVILNMHNEREYHSLESVRILRCLVNRKAVVSEINEDDDDDDLGKFVRGVPYGKLVDACVDLVNDRDERRRLESLSVECLRLRSQKDILSLALQSLVGRDKLGGRIVLPDPPQVIKSSKRLRYAKDGCTIDWHDYNARG